MARITTSKWAHSLPGPVKRKPSSNPTQYQAHVFTRPGPWAMRWDGLGLKAYPMQGPILHVQSAFDLSRLYSHPQGRVPVKVRTEGHKLHGLLSNTRHVPYTLRTMNDYMYLALKVRTNRLGNSFIPWGLRNDQWFYSTGIPLCRFSVSEVLHMAYCVSCVWM